MKYLIIFIVSLVGISCKNTSEQKNELKENKACPYEALVSETLSSSYVNGIQMNIDLEGKVLTNVKKLLNIEGKLRLNDSIFLNIEKALKTRSVMYSSDFLEIHNSLTQILCAIETDIANTTDLNLKARLTEDKMRKRTEYFDFLLGKTTVFNSKNELRFTVKKDSNIKKNYSSSNRKNIKIEVNDKGKIGNIFNGDSNKIDIKQDF